MSIESEFVDMVKERLAEISTILPYDVGMFSIQFDAELYSSKEFNIKWKAYASGNGFTDVLPTMEEAISQAVERIVPSIDQKIDDAQNEIAKLMALRAKYRVALRTMQKPEAKPEANGVSRLLEFPEGAP